jgi:hypothetical protein
MCPYPLQVCGYLLYSSFQVGYPMTQRDAAGLGGANVINSISVFHSSSIACGSHDIFWSGQSSVSHAAQKQGLRCHKATMSMTPVAFITCWTISLHAGFAETLAPVANTVRRHRKAGGNQSRPGTVERRKFHG